MAGKITITPNDGSTTAGQDPTIKFQGTGNSTDITLRVAADGSISIEGSAGQLMSITDSLSGTIWAVNDISGIPSIEVLDTGLVKLSEYNGSVQIGGDAFSSYLLIKGGLTLTGTTKAAGYFDAGTVAPTNTTRLNYDGYFYATRFYGDGSQLTGVTGATPSSDMYAFAAAYG